MVSAVALYYFFRHCNFIKFRHAKRRKTYDKNKWTRSYCSASNVENGNVMQFPQQYNYCGAGNN